MPPRWIRGLGALVPERFRDDVLADLDEEYGRWIRPGRGRWGADVWYVRQVLGAGLRLQGAGRQRRLGNGTGGRTTMDSLAQDLRYALRGLRQRPGFTATAVLTLALGIGATTAIFGVVQRVVLRPIPYADVDRLVRIAPDDLFYTHREEGVYFGENASAFSEVSVWGRGLYLLTEDGGEPEEIRGAVVQTNHFDLLGIEMALGRGFTEAESTEGTSRVAVLGHGLWVRRFGANPSILGTTIQLSGTAHTVVGILPEDHHPLEHDWHIWTPLVLDEGYWHAEMGMAMNARLAAGVSLSDAREDAASLFRGAAAHAGYTADEEWLNTVRVVPIRDWILGDATRRLSLLLGAVGFVLLIACANVANLLLARGHGRGREFAVRVALGAGSGRLVRQLFVESLTLGVLGGAFGSVLAWGMLETGTGAIPNSVPRADGAIDLPVVFAFAMAASIASAVLFGLAPAIRAGTTDVRGALAGDGAPGRSRRGARASAALIALEMALGIVLLTGSGLTLRSLWATVSQETGFRAEGVVTVRARPSSARYATAADVAQYFDDVTAALRRLPDVEAVGAIQFLPMTSGGAWGSYGRPGHPNPDVPPSAAFRRVTPDYFRAMGVPLLRGRPIAETDGPDDPTVILVNQALATEAFDAEDPVGQFLEVGYLGGAVEVVGVVADVRQTSLTTPSHPELYVSFLQSHSGRRTFAIRVSENPESRIPAIQQAIWSVDAETPLIGMATMEQVVRATTADPRFFAGLMTGFALLALTLGCVGVYGVMTYLVGLDRRAIGVRIAMGAPAGRVIRGTVARGLGPVATGAVAGLLLSALLADTLSATLYAVESFDPVTFVGAPLVLVGAAIAALYGPAYRASRTDPVEVLRDG